MLSAMLVNKTNLLLLQFIYFSKCVVIGIGSNVTAKQNHLHSKTKQMNEKKKIHIISIFETLIEKKKHFYIKAIFFH